MPFIQHEAYVEWLREEGSEPPQPRDDGFFYVPAAQISARFSILPFSAADEPEPPLAVELVKPVQVERRSILDRLFGRRRSEEREQQQHKRILDSMHQQRLQQKQRGQQLFAVLVPALRSLGVRWAYCRYDGGSDEGFSWLDHYQTQAGERIDLDVLVKRLHEMGVHGKLCAAGFEAHMRGVTPDQKMSDIKGFLNGWLADHWAWILLGPSYGTGEHSLYGAFTVDLDECSITDDSNALPVAKDIESAN